MNSDNNNTDLFFQEIISATTRATNNVPVGMNGSNEEANSSVPDIWLAQDSEKKLTSVHIVINNPDKIGIQKTEDLQKILKGLKPDYACACLETGKEGTHHIHVYMRKHNRWRVSQIKTAFLGRAHIEAAIKGDAANYFYITKDLTPAEINRKEKFIELGEPFKPSPGKRNDIIAIKDMVEKGFSAWDIVEAMPSHAFRIKEIEQLIRTYNASSTALRDVHTTFIETNETYKLVNILRQKYGFVDCFVPDFNRKSPFDEYNGQNVLILKQPHMYMPVSSIISMIDGSPYTFEARYYNRPAKYTRVFILSATSLYSFDQYAGSADELTTLFELIHDRWAYYNGEWVTL